MRSRASIQQHPLHPMVVPFPIALWIFAFVCDVVFAWGWGGPVWRDMGFYSMAGGVLGAVVAAVPGYLDYRTITKPPVKRLARFHMILNLGITALFVLNLWLRTSDLGETILPLILSFVGILVLGVSGWLGGELVYIHGVAVGGERDARSSGTTDRDRVAS